jgi:basic amino acid/polyamine antiporter, APA family
LQLAAPDIGDVRSDPEAGPSKTDVSPAAGPPGLRRDLGLLDAVGVGFGAIVGAGIFVVTGVAAGIAGPAFLVGLFLAGIAATCNALSSAQLAAEYPQSGGTYEYGYRVLTPWAGFAAGWMFLASKIAAAGTVALGLAAYLDAIVPGIHPRVLAVGAIVVFTVLNYFGIKRSSRANLAIVTVSLGALVTFVIAGLSTGAYQPANLEPFAPTGWRGILESGAILFFAYSGYARVATLGEEVHEPKRTIPRAIMVTIFGAILLYFAVAITAVGAVGAPGLAGTAAPLQVAAEGFGSPWVAMVVSVGGVTAMLGVILSQLLGLSRMAFAMARRGDLPGFLEHVHPRYAVPGRAVLVIGAIAAVVAATGTLRGVASAAAFTILLYYAIANVAAMRMPRQAKLYSDLVPWVGVIACVVLAFSLQMPVILAGLAVLAAGVVVRFVVRAARS